MNGRLVGRVALVTGAARGQGRAIANALAVEGADVLGVDICGPIPTVTTYALATRDDLDETVALVESAGRRMIADAVDVRDYAALETFVAKGVAELGRLDIVVANAGIASLSFNTLELNLDEWRDMIDTNLTGVFHTVKAAVPHIEAGGRGGAVVLTSSSAGLKAYAGIGHYVAAKHGVVGLMKTLALELAPKMIRVNTINPSNVNTPMLDQEMLWQLFVPDKEGQATKEDFAAASRASNAMPISWLEAEDIANAVLFLVSDEGRYITGVALPVDAGSLVR
jgi:SDR family mycofactocin-dependent oxidoreductase